MKPRPQVLILFALLMASSLAEAKDETFVIFNERKIIVAVPEGFTYSSGIDDSGTAIATLGNEDKTVSLTIRFLPDPRAQLATEDSRKDFLATQTQPYAESSVEGSYDFHSFKSRLSSGTYCSFTDTRLVGKTPPPNEFLHVTSGVKSWTGCATIFTIFSQELASTEFKTVLKLVQDSFEEKKPLGPVL